jgi:uncharacterized delta-60 repeat protein
VEPRVQADGKVVVAGTRRDDGNGDFALARYLSNGSLDPAFDTDGMVASAVTTSHDQLGAGTLVIQPDGKIVVGGDSPSFNSDVAVARYLPGGSLDTSFDGDGVAVTRTDDHVDTVSGLALQADGKIVATGSSGDGRLLVVRYLGDAVAPAEPAPAEPTPTTPTSGGGGAVAGSGGGSAGPSADLVLSGSATPSSVAVGDVVTVALRVSDDKNFGPATGVRLDVELPAGLELVKSYADRGAGCTLVAPGKLRCELDWLSSGAPYANVTISVRVTAAGKLSLAASVSHGGSDPDPLDNSFSVAVTAPVESAQGTTRAPEAKTAEAAAAVGVAVVAGPAGRPQLRLEVTVPKATTARVVVRRNGDRVLSRSVKLEAGHAVVHVALPARARAGVYRVEIRLGGGAKVVRTVRVRRR